MNADEQVTDRVMGWALREAAGGEEPPDLCSKVLVRAAAHDVPEADPDVDAGGDEPRTSWRAGLWLAAGLAVAIGMALLIKVRQETDKSGARPQDSASRQSQPASWTTVTTTEEMAKVDADCRALRVQADAPAVFLGIARLTRLERLDASRSSDDADVLDEAALRAIGARRTLRELRLDSRIEIEPAWLAHLAGLPLLETLTLSLVQVGDEGMATLAQLPSLRRLELAFDKTLTDRGLAYLTTIAGLRELVLRGCGALTASGLAELAKLRGLERLDLSATNGTAAAPAPGLPSRALQRAAWMLEVEMGLGAKPGGGVDDDVLRALGGLERLRELRLSGCPSISAKGLAALPKSVDALSLAWSRLLDDSALVAVAERLPGLRSFEITHCLSITDRGLQRLLAGCKLESLNIGGCRGLTAASLEPLLKQTTLRSLDVSGVPWVDKDAETKLRALPELRQLENRRDARGPQLPR